jgi:hypothetical protein
VKDVSRKGGRPGIPALMGEKRLYTGWVWAVFRLVGVWFRRIVVLGKGSEGFSIIVPGARIYIWLLENSSGEEALLAKNTETGQVALSFESELR